MGVLHAWAVAGGAALLGLPVFIHLLNRAKGRRILFPTTRFVHEAATARRRVRRLRDWLVLTLRVLAVAAIAGAFARVAWSAPAAPGGDRPWAVVVLDVSQSMAALGPGGETHAAARESALAALGSATLERADVVFAGQRPRAVFGLLSPNLAALRDEVRRSRPGPEAVDPSAALDLAASLVPPAARSNGEIVVVTDLQRSNWAAASFAGVPAGLAVRFVRVGGPPGPNAAVLRAWTTGFASRGRAFTITAELAAFGPDPLVRQVELAFGDQVQSRTVTLRPQQRRQESFTVVPSRGGPAVATFRLLGERDVLPADDSRAVAVRVRDARRVAVISTTPGDRIGGAPYFVSRALAASGDDSFSVEFVDARAMEQEKAVEALAADLWILVEPGRYSREAIERIGRHLSRGQALLFALQGAADADTVSELEAALGAALRLPVSYAALDRRAEPRHVVWADPGRRPFRIFGAGLARFTQDLVVTAGLRSASRGQDESGVVLARLSDGSAGLIVLPVVSGRLALLNLPLGGADSVAKSALFVPLLQELAADLLEGPERALRTGVSGRAVYLPLRSTGPGEWRVIDEVGAPVEGPKVADDRGSFSLSWSPATRTGGFRILQGDRVVDAFAVGLPPEESDPAPLDAEVLRERIAQGRDVQVGGPDAAAPSRGRGETWAWFVGAAFLALVLELLVLRAFRT